MALRVHVCSPHYQGTLEPWSRPQAGPRCAQQIKSKRHSFSLGLTVSGSVLLSSLSWWALQRPLLNLSSLPSSFPSEPNTNLQDRHHDVSPKPTHSIGCPSSPALLPCGHLPPNSVIIPLDTGLFFTFDCFSFPKSRCFYRRKGG